MNKEWVVVVASLGDGHTNFGTRPFALRSETEEAAKEAAGWFRQQNDTKAIVIKD